MRGVHGIDPALPDRELAAAIVTRLREEFAWPIEQGRLRLSVIVQGDSDDVPAAMAMAERVEALRDLPRTEWLVESLVAGACLTMCLVKHGIHIPAGNLEHLRNECRHANAKDMPEYDNPATRDANACDFLVTSLAQIDPGTSDKALAQAVANIFNCAGAYHFATHSFAPRDGRPPATLRKFQQPESIDDLARQQHARFVELLLAGHEFRIEFSQGYVDVGNLDTIRVWVGYCRRDMAKTKEFLKIWITRDPSREAERIADFEAREQVRKDIEP
jgi:hypothetical protein